jgi:hypothetical protein
VHGSSTHSLASLVAALALAVWAAAAMGQTKSAPAAGTNTTQGSTGIGQGGVRPNAGTSPNKASVQRAGARSKSTGDEDLEDLEVERRTVQGIEKPGTGTRPAPRPSAGTSPNVARDAQSAAAKGAPK